MTKRLLATLAVAGLGLSSFAAFGGTASAACPSSGAKSNPGWTVARPDGGTTYASGNPTAPPSAGATGGYIGSKSATGFIEAGGGADYKGGGGYIKGSATSTPVNGELEVSAQSRKLCAAGTTIPVP